MSGHIKYSAKVVGNGRILARVCSPYDVLSENEEDIENFRKNLESFNRKVESGKSVSYGECAALCTQYKKIKRMLASIL